MNTNIMAGTYSSSNEIKKIIMVAGTFYEYGKDEKYPDPNDRNTKPPKTKKNFIGAARALGYALTKNKYTVVVGIPDWGQLDNSELRYVLQGVNNYCQINDTGAFTPVTTAVAPTGAPTVALGSFSPPADPAPVSVPEKKKCSVIFFSPKQPDQVEEKDLLKGLPYIKLDKRIVGNLKTNFHTQFTQHLDLIDGAILIDGGEGTASIGYAAHSLDKPVIPIACMGGASQAIYDDLICIYLSELKEKNLINQNPSTLAEIWEEEDEDNPKEIRENLDHGDEIVALLKDVDKYLIKSANPLQRQVSKLFGLSLTFLILWIAAFIFTTSVLQPADYLAQQKDNATVPSATQPVSSVTPAPTPNSTSPTTNAIQPLPTLPWHTQAFLWLLLGFASALGNILRIFIALWQEEPTISVRLAYENTFLFITFIVSLLLAFGLALVYFFAGTSYINGLLISNADAQKIGVIAIFMSILGFAAGLLVPIQRLSDLLENLISKSETKATAS